MFYSEFHDGFGRLLSGVTGRRVAVIGHARPDGDCIGAQVALARLLRAGGCEALCVNADPVPRRLEFLRGGERFLTTDAFLATPAGEAAIFVDCADHGRAGERLRLRASAPLGNIDHHLSNSLYATENIVDTASSATCELLAGLALDRGLPIDPVTALALYVGILTDTGRFQFGSTGRRSFVLAGELVARGASPQTAGVELYERESPAKLRLLQRFLASLRMECGGRVCVGELPEAAFADSGATGEDTEGLVDYARNVDGVDIGVLIEERNGGAIKASLRAKDAAYRVDMVAGRFGGGGHACAAGLNVRPVPSDFRARLLVEISRALAEADARKS